MVGCTGGMAYKCASQMAKGDMVQHKINCNNIMYSEGFCVARLLHYDNRETPLAGNFVGRCQGHKSDVSTQSWVLISEKISFLHLFTDEDPGLGRNV